MPHKPHTRFVAIGTQATRVRRILSAGSGALRQKSAAAFTKGESFSAREMALVVVQSNLVLSVIDLTFAIEKEKYIFPAVA